MIKHYGILALSFLTLGLGACSSNDKQAPLQGERIPVLTLQKDLMPADAQAGTYSVAIPTAWHNDYWPEAGGYPNHSMQNLDLGQSPLSPKWKTSIGKGSSKELPLTAQPIITKDKIFTLDSHATLSAFDLQQGKKVWSISAQSEQQDDEVITGGLAFAGGAIYVTNGYNELLAVRADNGEILWRTNIGTPSRAAPTITDKRIYVTTIDNRTLALDAITGAILWDYAGLSETSGLVGSASPAADDNIVIPAFSSGELTALRAENGAVLWSDNLSALRRTGGLTSISDIKAPPVIDKDIVIAINFSGRMVAIDERTGGRIWQKDLGSASMPWVAGNHIFVVTQDNNLVALSRESGTIRWVTQLPSYKNPTKKKDPIQWNGPVMAGGRLLMLNSAGELAEADPQTGEITATTKIGSSFYLPPVIAGGVMYVLAEDGTLLAFE